MKLLFRICAFLILSLSIYFTQDSLRDQLYRERPEIAQKIKMDQEKKKKEEAIALAKAEEEKKQILAQKKEKIDQLRKQFVNQVWTTISKHYNERSGEFTNIRLSINFKQYIDNRFYGDLIIIDEKNLSPHTFIKINAAYDHKTATFLVKKSKPYRPLGTTYYQNRFYNFPIFRQKEFQLFEKDHSFFGKGLKMNDRDNKGEDIEFKQVKKLDLQKLVKSRFQGKKFSTLIDKEITVKVSIKKFLEGYLYGVVNILGRFHFDQDHQIKGLQVADNLIYFGTIEMNSSGSSSMSRGFLQVAKNSIKLIRYSTPRKEVIKIDLKKY